MSLKVLINQESNYLLLKVQGEYSLDAFKSLFSKIHEESIEKGYKNILVDISEVSGTTKGWTAIHLEKPPPGYGATSKSHLFIEVNRSTSSSKTLPSTGEFKLLLFRMSIWLLNGWLVVHLTSEMQVEVIRHKAMQIFVSWHIGYRTPK